MKVGDKVIFIGKEYNISKILKYEEIFKDRELIVEAIIECPCDKEYMNKIKFKNLQGYYRASFFKRIDE